MVFNISKFVTLKDVQSVDIMALTTAVRLLGVRWDL